MDQDNTIQHHAATNLQQPELAKQFDIDQKIETVIETMEAEATGSASTSTKKTTKVSPTIAVKVGEKNTHQIKPIQSGTTHWQEDASGELKLEILDLDLPVMSTSKIMLKKYYD